MPRLTVDKPKTQDMHTIISMMIKTANELDEMVRTEIPESFPFLRVSGGPDGDWGQYYSQDEFFGARHKSELEDAHRAIDTLNKLQTHIQSTDLLISSLYPTEFQGSTHEIKIRDTFDRLKDWCDDVNAVIDQCKQIVVRGIDSSLKPVINRGNLRKLRHHITRIGFEYANGRIPAELSVETDAEEIAQTLEAEE